MDTGRSSGRPISDALSDAGVFFSGRASCLSQFYCPQKLHLQQFLGTVPYSKHFCHQKIFLGIQPEFFPLVSFFFTATSITQKAPSCRRAFQLLLLQGSPSQLASGSRPLYPPEIGVCEFLRANCEDVKLSPLRKRSLALLHFVLAGGSSALNFNLCREDRIASGWPIFSSSAGTSTALLSPSEDGDVSWR